MTRRQFQLAVPWIPPAVWLALGIFKLRDDWGSALLGGIWFGFAVSVLMWLAFWTAFSWRHWAISWPSALAILSIILTANAWIMSSGSMYRSPATYALAAFLIPASALTGAVALMRIVQSRSGYSVFSGENDGPGNASVSRAKIRLTELFMMTALVAVAAGLARAQIDFSVEDPFPVSYLILDCGTHAVIGAVLAAGCVLCVLALLADPRRPGIQITALAYQIVQFVLLMIWYLPVAGSGSPLVELVGANLVSIIALPLCFCLLLWLAHAAGYRLVRAGRAMPKEENATLMAAEH
jgi:hypothetical protein